MEINIEEIVLNKIREMETAGVIKKTIEDALEKNVLSAINSAIGDYKIRRSIEDKVEKQVSEIVSDIGFTAYNGFIAEKIKEITEGALRDDIVQKIQETFKEVLVKKRESIKLSEICEAYREYICDSLDEHEKYDLQNFYASVKESSLGWLTFKFSKEEEDRFDKDDTVEFTVHRNHGDRNNGWISTIRIDGELTKGKLKFGHLSKVETLLINLYYNKTNIEIDVESEDDIDTSFDIEY